MSAAPKPNDTYLHFNGIDNYVEIPTSPSFSLAKTGAFSISAWLRPDVLNFSREESTGYVHWLGKGDAGQQEWAFRMYSHTNTEDPPRPNRISFYVFNADGGLGVGSYFQDTVTKGEWIHVVGMAASAQTSMYKDGLYRRCDTFRGPATGACPIHKDPATGEQLVIDPTPSAAPLRIGTRDFASFFQGGISKVRLWNRAISAHEIQALFATDTVPQAGLVAEYRFDKKTGATATDSTGHHNGTIFGAQWSKQT